MDNYKIKVKDEAESKEAQELFVQLGFEKTGFSCDEFPCYLATWGGGFSDYVLDSLSISRERKELTLPQLRDLVVLKRNRMDDQNHVRHGCVAYLDSEGYTYTYDKQLECWIKTDDKPITHDPALISGAEALHDLAHGKEVEANNSDFGYWIDARNLSVKDFFDDIHIFRLKPQTIKLELELPKPFEPEEDCHVYILDDGKTDGYRRYSYEVHGDKGNTFIGIWRTEDEINQVVEQLRKIRGTNS